VTGEPSERLTFVDTNVLAYAHDRSEPSKQRVAAALLASLWHSRTGVVSTQVLQELYVVLTRKFRPPLPGVTARRLVASYGRWRTVVVDVPIILWAATLAERRRISFWDALIVTAARAAGAARLVSEDLQPGLRVGGLRIENPFTT
jgi:predicted nucleic acid-binding protein